MKIAIASQNQQQITSHAGQWRKFWIYETGTAGSTHRTLLEFSAEQSFHNSAPNQPPGFDEVQVLMAQGMCDRLVQRLQQYGIEGIVTIESLKKLSNPDHLSVLCTKNNVRPKAGR